MSEPARFTFQVRSFAVEDVAKAALAEVQAAGKAGTFTLSDYALVHKAPGGKITITDDKSANPGAMRGGLFGGTAGLVLAVASGPIGLGAVAAGAAIGAATSALKDSGVMAGHLEEISRLMEDGRTVLLVAAPLEEKDAVAAFLDGNEVIQASDRKFDVDLIPGRDLGRAIQDYKHHEED